MPRRLTYPALALIALALALAGCGGGDEGSASLADSLAYMPKDAPLVVAFQTDVEGEQYRNLDRMLSKFPFGGQVKAQIKQSFARQGADYAKDVKPVLGKEVVVAITDPASIVNDTAEDKYVLAWPADGEKLENIFEKDKTSRKSGQIDGADVYESADGSVSLLKGDTAVAAGDRQALEAALKRPEGDDKLTEEEFTAPFQGLPEDAMVRVYADLEGLLRADPDTAEARQVRWVNGVRKLGVTASAQRDGIAVDARVTTEGLRPEDVPLATGDQAPPIARFGDYAVGLRDAGHATDWVFEVAARGDKEDPVKLKRQLGRRLGGIDVDRDLLAQFSGASTVTGRLDGTVTVRSDVKDPDAMRTTLAKMRKSRGSGNLRISDAGGLLKATDEEGDEVYFGMVGDAFVASDSSPARAKQLASVEPRPLPGARGATVFVADGETIAKQIVRESQGGGSAGMFAGPLGDLTAWVSASPEAMRLSGKLKVE